MSITGGFEKGTLGATVATTDPGDATAWDTVHIGTSGALVYDNTQVAHGSQACKLAVSGDYVQWLTAFGTQTDHYGRMYVYVSAWPAAQNDYVLCRSGSTKNFEISVGTDGKVRLSASAGNTVGTSINSVPTAQWFRLEWHFQEGLATGEAKLYLDSKDSTVATETLTASMSGATSSNQEFYGFTSAGTFGITSWIDCITELCTAYPGPFPNFTVAPTVSGSTPVGSTLTCDGGTQSGTFTLSYQWTKDGSNIVGATSSTYVTQAGDATHAIGCTVTATGQQATSETASSTSSNTITVTAASSLSTVAGKIGTSGTAVMQKAKSGWTYITGKTGTSGTAVDQKGAGSFTKIKGH